MKLSETSHANEWLKQFEVDDRPAAIALLDAVKFVPGGDVVQGIRSLVEEFLAGDPARLPAAALPVLSLEDMVLDPPKSVPEVFTTFDPAQPIASAPGSEALVAQMLREIGKGAHAASLVDHPLSRQGLINEKARTLLFVTDYIGSGQQIESYVEAWWRNTTIKSWRSRSHIKIVVVAYAATAKGKAVVEAIPRVETLLLAEMAPGTERIRQNPLERIEQVCRIYAKRARLRNPLGYKGSAGLFASSFSVPNNLPAILIRSGKDWFPFFDGRTVPSGLAAEIEKHSPASSLPVLLREKGEMKLALQIENGEIDQRWRLPLTVLVNMPATESELALRLGISIPQARGIVDSLAILELVDQAGKITELGKSTLNRHRARPRRTTAGLQGKPNSYYPLYQ